jgi:thymidylate synthase (FAD)
MKFTKPYVRVIARPEVDWDNVRDFVLMIGGESWYNRIIDNAVDSDGEHLGDAELLIEFGGRECYRSWDVGLNPNVSKVRTDSAEYLENILSSAHGSVLQHANYSFILHNVTRVATHEMVRHAIGTAFSQESMRYVRLDDIPFWMPDWALEDEWLMRNAHHWLEETEKFQLAMAEHFKLDDPTTKFSEKKAKTSFMRRFSPQGVSTGMLMTANVRALRWIIERRSEEAAEEEIRIIADLIAQCMKEEAPVLFGDFEKNDKGEWIPQYKKV